MDRLTRPSITVDPTAARFMGPEVKIQDIGDKLLHLILNGPTINSINKDTLRHLVRQLYTELKCYEDAIVPLNPGDSVYWLLEDDGWYISDPEIVADVGTKGFYLSGVRDSDEPGDNPSFNPWEEIGKTCFLTKEEAEAALVKMKEEA